jgi:hypothetical protein
MVACWRPRAHVVTVRTIFPRVCPDSRLLGLQTKYV